MVNHRRRILGTTRGHPGSFNDKTLILFDEFVQDVKSGKFDDYTFELLEKRGDEFVHVKYKGVGLLLITDTTFGPSIFLLSLTVTLLKKFAGLNGWNQCAKMSVSYSSITCNIN
jgi:hypothetical protein